MCGAKDWTDRSDPSIGSIPARAGGDQSRPSAGVRRRDIPLRAVSARYSSIAERKDHNLASRAKKRYMVEHSVVLTNSLRTREARSGHQTVRGDFFLAASATRSGIARFTAGYLGRAHAGLCTVRAHARWFVLVRLLEWGRVFSQPCRLGLMCCLSSLHLLSNFSWSVTRSTSSRIARWSAGDRSAIAPQS
jgi:hypothetical protein